MPLREQSRIPGAAVAAPQAGKTDRAGNKVEPTAAPECYEDGEHKQSPHRPERLIRATPVVTAGRPRIHSPAEWMRLHGSAPCDCKSFEEVAEPKPTAAPEGQQGEAKASEAAKDNETEEYIVAEARKWPTEKRYERPKFEAILRTVVSLADQRDAARAEVEQLRGECARKDRIQDMLNAEVERLRAKLAETVAEMSDDHLKDIEFMGADADTREAAMRAAAAKLAREHAKKYGRDGGPVEITANDIAEAIERLPLGTGGAPAVKDSLEVGPAAAARVRANAALDALPSGASIAEQRAVMDATGRAQADAIKAAVVADHHVGDLQDQLAEAQRNAAQAVVRVRELEGEREEMLGLLVRGEKYVREDRAVTPGNTRLARWAVEVARLTTSAAGKAGS